MTGTESFYLYHLTLTPHYQDPQNWTTKAHRIIQEHANFLDDLGRAGVLGFAGRTLFEPGDPRLFGIAIGKAESLEAAQALWAGDPAVQHGIQQAVIYPYSMGIRHLENLF